MTNGYKLRKKRITFDDRINELKWPPMKGIYNHLFKNKQRRCHICGLTKVQDLRPMVIRNHYTNQEPNKGVIECIRCILTGAGPCDLGYPNTWQYASKEQMIEVSIYRKEWEEYDKWVWVENTQ